jgi:chromosomal replication initiation ATPase DnaA
MSKKTSSKKFVEYLDSHHTQKNIPDMDFILTNRIIENHFFKNKLQEKTFTGKTQPFPANNDPALQVFYDMYSKSIWNSISTPSPVVIDSAYSIWQKEHEATFLFKPIASTKTTCQIDVSVNTISDILGILHQYPYDETVEYNIDLKSLHQIQGELTTLNEMIGLESMKQSILNQLLYFIQELHIGKDTSDFKHTVFYGPPGTGKTEIAKIIGKMYAKLGVLKNNIFKKVTRSDLIAGYLGQTAIKTKKVVEECLGGVLFIDEAYSLASSNENDSYSKECLDILCESLSDHKNDLMVIIAGYEEELSHTFFKANQGLESRFIWRFTMQPYSAKELRQIFLKKADEQGWSIDPVNLPDSWFDQKKDAFPHFGRDMELLLTYTKISHGRRIYGKVKELRKKITIEDLNGGYDILLKNRKSKVPPPHYLHGLYT